MVGDLNGGGLKWLGILMVGGVAWSSQRPLGEAQLPNRTRPPRSLSFSDRHHHGRDDDH